MDSLLPYTWYIYIYIYIYRERERSIDWSIFDKPNKPNYTRVIVNYDPLEDRRIDINLLIYPMNQVDSSGGSRYWAEAFLPSAILFFLFFTQSKGGGKPPGSPESLLDPPLWVGLFGNSSQKASKFGKNISRWSVIVSATPRSPIFCSFRILITFWHRMWFILLNRHTVTWCIC